MGFCNNAVALPHQERMHHTPQALSVAINVCEIVQMQLCGEKKHAEAEHPNTSGWLRIVLHFLHYFKRWIRRGPFFPYSFPLIQLVNFSFMVFRILQGIYHACKLIEISFSNICPPHPLLLGAFQSNCVRKASSLQGAGSYDNSLGFFLGSFQDRQRRWVVLVDRSWTDHGRMWELIYLVYLLSRTQQLLTAPPPPWLIHQKTRTLYYKLAQIPQNEFRPDPLCHRRLRQISKNLVHMDLFTADPPRLPHDGEHLHWSHAASSLSGQLQLSSREQVILPWQTRLKLEPPGFRLLLLRRPAAGEPNRARPMWPGMGVQQ